MGHRSAFNGVPKPRQAAIADGYFQEAATLTKKMLGALPDNRALIEHIKLHGLPKL
jgi:hypothetical protein